MDCVIVAVAHEGFKKIKLKDMKELMNNAPVLIDVRGMFDEEAAKRKGFYYKEFDNIYRVVQGIFIYPNLEFKQETKNGGSKNYNER